MKLLNISIYFVSLTTKTVSHSNKESAETFQNGQFELAIKYYDDESF